MIGIIGAMAVEVILLIDMMARCEEEKLSGMIFYTGVLYGSNVVVAVSGVGKVNAAVCAQTQRPGTGKNAAGVYHGQREFQVRHRAPGDERCSWPLQGVWVLICGENLHDAPR